MVLSDFRSTVLAAQAGEPLAPSLTLPVLLTKEMASQAGLLPCLGVDEMLVALWLVSGT